MNPKFWRDRRVFLTGHTGFKGGWLALWLSKMGATVCGYGLPPSSDSPSFFDSCGVSACISSSLLADIRDLESVKKAIKDFSPDIVLHLAAQALVREAYRDPVTTFDTNVMGVVHILEAVRSVPSVKIVINVTTDKCYENQEWVWGYRESDRLGGSEPYSASKACSELVTEAYRKSFLNRDVLVATARAGNVIGGGDWSKDRLIPDIVRATETATILEIRNPDAVRPWQHVLDPLSGYLLLAEQLWNRGDAIASAWNFGPEASAQRSVAWVVDEFSSHFDLPVRWEKSKGEHPHETSYLTLDSTKVRRECGWNPRFALKEALQWTADWYTSWRLDRSNILSFTERQIAEYELREPEEE